MIFGYSNLTDIILLGLIISSIIWHLLEAIQYDAEKLNKRVSKLEEQIP